MQHKTVRLARERKRARAHMNQMEFSDNNNNDNDEQRRRCEDVRRSSSWFLIENQIGMLMPLQNATTTTAPVAELWNGA